MTSTPPSTPQSPVDEPTMPLSRAFIDALDAISSAPDGAAANSLRTPFDSTPTGRDELPVSVWATAQTSPAAQRKGRYVPESTAHPAKMLPAVAAHAIAHYTRPGDLVLDPMCGIGTTLVEAIDLDRRAVGVEYEPHWADIARANLRFARKRGRDHDGQVVRGDARQLETLLPDEYAGQVALVVTSPPYGPSVHGQVKTDRETEDGKVRKHHYRYGSALDRGNLANIGHHRLLAGFTRILTACARVLRPGGHVVITVRPWREHAELIDLPSQVVACGIAAGLVPVERCVALLARVADTDLVTRGSFFQRDFIRKQRDAGLPLHLIAHEDVIVLRTTEDRDQRHVGRAKCQVEARHEYGAIGPGHWAA
ncbi:TRM11 family SAM-dependent methyltransferase [Amycolatopsis sp. lyj-346]|uniref:TRM11 family SAM-dependent methyltransferase n=1 Tax=Amycolatopsis sp. lyj-346 TaxID=2789289 RepID=UPI00397D2B7D